MAAPVVEMKHITKCFAKVVANKDVSLEVNEGEDRKSTRLNSSHAR